MIISLELRCVFIVILVSLTFIQFQGHAFLTETKKQKVVGVGHLAVSSALVISHSTCYMLLVGEWSLCWTHCSAGCISKWTHWGDQSAHQAQCQHGSWGRHIIHSRVFFCGRCVCVCACVRACMCARMHVCVLCVLTLMFCVCVCVFVFHTNVMKMCVCFSCIT